MKRQRNKGFGRAQEHGRKTQRTGQKKHWLKNASIKAVGQKLTVKTGGLRGKVPAVWEKKKKAVCRGGVAKSTNLIKKRNGRKKNLKKRKKFPGSVSKKRNTMAQRGTNRRHKKGEASRKKIVGAQG